MQPRFLRPEQPLGWSVLFQQLLHQDSGGETDPLLQGGNVEVPNSPLLEPAVDAHTHTAPTVTRCTAGTSGPRLKLIEARLNLQPSPRSVRWRTRLARASSQRMLPNVQALRHKSCCCAQCGELPPFAKTQQVVYEKNAPQAKERTLDS